VGRECCAPVTGWAPRQRSQRLVPVPLTPADRPGTSGTPPLRQMSKSHRTGLDTLQGPRSKRRRYRLHHQSSPAPRLTGKPCYTQGLWTQRSQGRSLLALSSGDGMSETDATTITLETRDVCVLIHPRSTCSAHGPLFRADRFLMRPGEVRHASLRPQKLMRPLRTFAVDLAAVVRARPGR
jgi:hypothetical protein